PLDPTRVRLAGITLMNGGTSVPLAAVQLRNFNRTLAILPTADPGPGPLLLTIPATMLADQAGNVPPTDFTLRFTEQAPGNYTLGQTVSGTLTPGLGSDIYRIDGAEGKRLLLQNLSTLGTQDGASRWTLYTPDDHRLASAYLLYQYAGYNDLPALLPSTGTYTLVVSGGSAGPFDYRFSANTVVSAPTDILL